MKLQNLLFALFTCFLLTQQSNAVEVLFRNMPWGSTMQQVKAKEKAYLLQETPNGLMYEDQIVHRNFNSAYFFQNNKLFRGVYSLQEQSSEEQGVLNQRSNYVLLYKILLDELVKVHGVPDKQKELPKLGNNEDVTNFLDKVAERNDGVYSQWKVGDVLITLALKGVEGKLKVLKIVDHKVTN
ncbi:MAG TPA: hypothetical protein V6C96_00545 [Vampirovibrionales bacterium]